MIAFYFDELRSVCDRGIDNSSFYNGVKYCWVGNWLRIDVILLTIVDILFTIIYYSFILIAIIVLISSPFQMFFFN